ncbi:MAG: family 20 glycosylhydrolase [Planctomycetes bacterium]|nr:family 20 glycosylhydrolase [Planctomycetota bacterium]
MSDLSTLPPLLLPSPRQLTLTGGTVRWTEPLDVGAQVIALPGDEAYHLAITNDGIRWAWRSAAGRRHAAATVAQLRIQYGDTLPCLVIDDAPVFAKRGFMLDISRDRVPTMAHLYEVVDTLASWKMNHLQLYTEHTFAYVGHDDVWRDASPMTADEIRALDIYCRERGIELAANQNCFGHLSSWFKHSRYAPLAEIAPTGTWDFNGLVTRTGGFSLCPSDPRSLALIDDLLGQLLPNFSSPLVNIGCDETFDLGQGRSRYEVSRRGRAAVYLEFVAKVCAVAKKHGKRPQFWADIALEHPEALSGLPEDLIGLAWGYEPDAPFAKWCDQLRTAGREVWVCPGTSCWRSITGRTTERRGNMLAAARDGAGHGAAGYLVTAWGDLGHRQQWPITLHALAEGAHRAWSGTQDYDVRASALHAFQDRSLAIGTWLDDLGDVDRALRTIGGRPAADGSPTPLRNASALFTDTTKAVDEEWLPDATAWEETANQLEQFIDTDRRGKVPQTVPSRLVQRELTHTLAVAMTAATRALVRRAGTSIDEVHDCVELYRDLIAQHRDLWLQRCRPGGLDDSCRHYQRLINEFAVG